MQVTLDDGEEKVYELTAAQADEGEGTKNLKLRNVKGQGGVRIVSKLNPSSTILTAEAICTM